MAYSYVFYDGDDTDDPITVPFPYISIADISLWLDGTEVDFTWLTSSTIQPEEALTAGSNNVEVRRTTPRSAPEVTFSQAAQIAAADLNTANLQLLYIAQELLDSYGVIVPTAATNVLFGTFAAMPSAGTVGRLYVATDTLAVYSDDGADWLLLEAPAFTGDVLKDAGGTVQTIAANAVTNGKMATMAAATIKGSVAGGDPADLTATQATAILNVVTNPADAGGLKGLVPAPAAGDAAALKYLKADGTWATVPTASATTRATAAAVLAETNEATYVSPDRVKNNQGVAKAWVSFNGTGSLSVIDSYNVTSVTDLGTGSYRVNLAITMGNDDFVVLTSGRKSSTDFGMVIPQVQTTTTVTVNTRQFKGLLADFELVNVAIFGDLP